METSLTEARIRDCTAAGLWRNEGLDTYLGRWAMKRPDKAAVVDRRGATRGPSSHGPSSGRPTGYGLTVSARRCHLLSAAEPEQFALVLLATARLGAVVNPIPPISAGGFASRASSNRKRW
jgi:hypothetical protein